MRHKRLTILRAKRIKDVLGDISQEILDLNGSSTDEQEDLLNSAHEALVETQERWSAVLRTLSSR